MASSNRHWPSMFKSKPHHHHHQWQHDINSPLLPSRSSPFTSGCEERSPEPKPRWNPKPEQIRILEAIFNSGMVNPPRDEIRRIRAQLQEYGQVGDANVFYWFQNRKSRSKHKLRLLHNSKHTSPQPQPPNSSSPSSSSSSSSPKSTKPHKNKNYTTTNNNINLSLGGSSSSVMHKDGTVTVDGNPILGMFPAEPAFLFPVSAMATVGGFEGIPGASQSGFVSGETMSNIVAQEQKPVVAAAATVGPCTGLLLSEIMNSVSYGTNLSVKEHEEMRMKMLQNPQICYTTSSNSTPTSSYNNNLVVPSPTSASVTVPSVCDHHLQVQAVDRFTVFINEMELEVTSGVFNVREAFGSEEAVLINSAGQPVLTDEYGVLLHPLQHGASYYVI